MQSHAGKRGCRDELPSWAMSPSWRAEGGWGWDRRYEDPSQERQWIQIMSICPQSRTQRDAVWGGGGRGGWVLSDWRSSGLLLLYIWQDPTGTVEKVACMAKECARMLPIKSFEVPPAPTMLCCQPRFPALPADALQWAKTLIALHERHEIQPKHNLHGPGRVLSFTPHVWGSGWPNPSAPQCWAAAESWGRRVQCTTGELSPALSAMPEGTGCTKTWIKTWFQEHLSRRQNYPHGHTLSRAWAWICLVRWHSIGLALALLGCLCLASCSPTACMGWWLALPWSQDSTAEYLHQPLDGRALTVLSDQLSRGYLLSCH